MSSKRGVRRRSCTGKVRHRDRSAAMATAKRMMSSKTSWLVPYACRLCGGWHVGHATAAARRALNERKRALDR